ncbi:helix-turn-helix domain-containing protein [uncultured Maricaulis sp.]|uniref:ArsR/SmtB family transcription factor n=1 Tax=uncultured Maricaulis sp. TaxID=174710 RepID=UPI00261DA5FD|nr:helix-turn-helix domain-containing protein [uncultured Maricaulis sp.]
MNDHDAAARLSTLAHDVRLRVFRTVMSAGPAGMPASKIADAVEISRNNLSAHLNIFLQAGLMDVEPSGRQRIYRINLTAVSDTIGYLVADCCQGHPEVCDALGKHLRTSC